MVGIGTIEATLTLNSSQFNSGVKSAEGSLKEFAGSAQQAAGEVTTASQEMSTEATTATGKVATGAEDAEKRVTRASVSTQGSMKGLALGFSQTATSAFSLYQSFDAIEKAEYAHEKAALAAQKADQAVTDAQIAYTKAVDKFGESSPEAENALNKLNLAKEAASLADERSTITQGNVNESMTRMALSVIPAVISGLDGMTKLWHSFSGINFKGTFTTISDGLKSLGGANSGLLMSGIMGIGALGMGYMAFTAKTPEMKAAFSVLAGAMVAAASAQWILNAAQAFGLSLTVAGIAIVAAAGITAAVVYGLSNQYGAPIESAPAIPTATGAGTAVSGGGTTGGGGGGTAGYTQEEYDADHMTDAHGRKLERDISGNWQLMTWLEANPQYRKSTYAEAGTHVQQWYAEGGLAMTPQVAMLAEKEPEYIIPASKMNSFGGSPTINFYIDGSKDVDLIMNEIMRRLRENAGVKY